MYSSHVYFLANWFTSTLNLMMYPLITSSVSFWFLKMNDSSFENFMRWYLTLSLSTLQGSTYGFMFGIIYNDIESAANVLSTIASCLTYTCGVYVNLKTGPWYIKFMGYISPFRYTCEKLMRILLRGLPYVDTICDNYAWTYDTQITSINLIFLLVFFFIGWFVIVYKSKEF